MAADNSTQAIESVPFKPSSGGPNRWRFSVWHYVIGGLAVLTAWLLWFLFTSKSVQLDFQPAPQNVRIQGGFSFELGGVWLLREGSYQVSAEAELHEPMQASIDVGEQRNQVVQLKFVPLPGTLQVVTRPPDARTRVGSQRFTGEIELSSGEHELTVEHPRYLPHTQTIAIRGMREVQQVQVSLAPNWADVTVSSSPPGAQVAIDGQPWPTTTPTTVEALSGEREISVSLPGYKVFRQKILAQAGQAQQLEGISLVQADAQIMVSSTPDGSGVLLNGKFIGQTPLTLDVKSGHEHQIDIVRNGYVTATRRLKPARGAQTPVNVRLTPLLGKVNIQASPATARLLVNGQDRGNANQTLELPIRPHDIQIGLDGYAGYRAEITPKAGLTQEIKVRLLTHAQARIAALQPSITAPDGQNLKLFEPYPFRLGASRREPGRRANETLRTANMSRLFYLATQETTNAQFRKFAAGHDSGKYVEASLNEDDQPAVRLGWHDAAAYCNWLSEQQQLPPFYTIEFGKVIGMNYQSTGYRLPTEAEWSWAARALDRADEAEAVPLLKFPWGDNLPPPDRHGNYADRAASSLVGRVIFGYNDNYAASSPVGIYKPNHRDLYDMGGNAAEWVNDYYEIAKNTAEADPTGPTSGEYHVIKGSSWMHGSVTELRFSFRDYGIDGRQDVGFRIARYAE